MKKHLLIICFILFTKVVLFATVYTATLCPANWAGDLGNPFGYPAGGLSTGDVLVIPAGCTITVTGNITITVSVTLNVFGTLEMKQGKKLNLSNTASQFNVKPGGMLIPSAGGGANASVAVGGTNVWQTSDGFQTGALPSGYVLNTNCYFNGSGILTGGAACGSNGSLPIELVSFTANAYNTTQVQLIWVIATEINNDYYTIERSFNGIDFSSLAYYAGGGTNYNTKTYTAIDENPSEGINYYKLKQTDYDGSYTYSPIADVDFNSINAGYQVTSTINDNASNLMITSLNKNLNGEIGLEIVDMYGRILNTKVITLINGSYLLNINLPGGCYIANIIDKKTSFRKTFIIR